MGICPVCGERIDDGMPKCTRCALGDGVLVLQVPWEIRQEIGWLSAFCATIKTVLFGPERFFTMLAGVRTFQGAFTFPIVVSWLLVLVQILFVIINPSLNFSVGVFFGFALLFFILPIVCLMGLFFDSGVIHLFALMFGGKGGFAGTFNCLSYTKHVYYVISAIIGALGVLLLNKSAIFMFSVSFGIVVGVWYFLILALGLRRIHKLSSIKAVCVMFFYLLVCAGVLYALNNVREKLVEKKGVVQGVVSEPVGPSSRGSVKQ